MPSTTDGRWKNLVYILISLLLAMGIWYIVVGREQVDAQFDVRLDYRGLPEGLVVRDGLTAKATVRLRGSTELLRTLHNRDLTYTVDLADVQRGANVRLLEVGNMPEFRAYEVLDVMPPRLMLEVDGLIEKTLPVEMEFTPLPEDSPLRLASTSLDPGMALIKGPESLINPLEKLVIKYDLARDLTEGSKAINVAIAAPDQVGVTPPVTTLRYTLALKTKEISLRRVVQLDATVRDEYKVEPRQVALKVEVPEARTDDAAYLAAIRVVVRPSDKLEPGGSEQVAVLVMLPQGARLSDLQPPLVRITRKQAPRALLEQLPQGEDVFSLDGSEAPEEGRGGGTGVSPASAD